MSVATEHGLYIISKDFFNLFPSARFADDKEFGRPYYYAFRDSDGLLWMIPISTKVENARPKIERAEKRYGKGNCLYYHIGLIAGQERLFRITNLFPVSEEYIDHAFKIREKPYIIETSSLIKEVERKAMTFINMVERGSMTSDCDILTIKSYLLSH